MTAQTTTIPAKLTGNVGRELASLLHSQGHPIRAAVTSAKSAQNLPYPDIPWTLFDFDQPATYATAFAGVDRRCAVDLRRSAPRTTAGPC